MELDLVKNSETSGQKKEEVENDIIRENKKTLRLRYNRGYPNYFWAIWCIF